VTKIRIKIPLNASAYVSSNKLDGPIVITSFFISSIKHFRSHIFIQSTYFNLIIKFLNIMTKHYKNN